MKGIKDIPDLLMKCWDAEKENKPTIDRGTTNKIM